MKIPSLLLLFTLITLSCLSQNRFQIEVNLGYAFQNKMMFDNERVKSTSTFGFRFGANYLLTLRDNFYLETGLYGKYNRGNRKVTMLEFTANTLRAQMPVYVGYKINDRWKFSVGASLENNKDFDDINLKTEKNNLRYDLITKVIYTYNNKIQFSFYTNWMLHPTADIYTIGSPRNGMYLGAIYQFGKTIKTK